MDQQAFNHRSIRAFKDEPVDYQALLAVAQATSSSEFLQEFTVIRVTDQALRDAIVKITNCAFIAGPGELFIFVVDTGRDIRIADSQTDNHNFRNWNAFLAGAFDSALAAQNVLATAERSGLGGVMLGSILNDPQQMIDLLHLPRYTFPLLGLMVGVPDQLPDAKPRLPKPLVVGENSYPQATADLAAYDRQLADYYQSRAWNPREETFTSLVQRHLSADQHHRDEIGAILKAQGFVLPQ
ncbi:nitroreductase family protein [Lacticaseibacillus sp. GG6-2]